jgi:ATP-binding cassette, subfamily B, bacterial PglK
MGILSRRDQKKIIAITIVQVLMGVVDLLGVIGIGLMGAISVTGLNPEAENSNVGAALRFLNLSNVDIGTQVLVIGGGSALLLICRTLFSIFATRRILFFLSRRGAELTSNLVSKLLAQPLLNVQKRTVQETVFALTNGIEVITLQVIATGVVLTSDIALLLIMSVGLFLIDPITALSTLLVFTLIGVLLYRILNSRAGIIGAESSELSIRSNERIVEVLSTFRESMVHNRRNYYAREIRIIRFSIADKLAELNFMPYVGKYVIETSVILGGVIIGSLQFIQGDAIRAVSTMAIFIAAGSRIAPAVLRVQQSSITVQRGLGAAIPALNLIAELGSELPHESLSDALDISYEGFSPEISVKNVSYTYPNSSTNALRGINLEITEGRNIAVVGPSGAGKTTLIDVLLGVISPSDGQILISGVTPFNAIEKWPGAISYVPQDANIIAGTIRENVALGYPLEIANDELVSNALRAASLDQFVFSLPDGIDTQVGERGARLSGGQRQRLGIARAMFTCPRLLVLDEATSALDGETELQVSAAIQAMHGSTTVIVIAHRLSTVQSADEVIYLVDGQIKARGTFNDLRRMEPGFDREARLMGL